MSNILPKKSWHLYNDDNKAKVKRDETSARIEKEKNDERAKTAEREHRLSILRSRANIKVEEKVKAAVKEFNEYSSDKTKIRARACPQRFELFSPEDGEKDQIKGEYEKELELELDSNSKGISKRHQQPCPTEDTIKANHFKNDPFTFTSSIRTQGRTKFNKKSDEYSFV